MTESETKPCPNCGSSMTVLAAYSTWCDNCNWNLAPTETAKPTTGIGPLFERLGARSSQSLHSQFLRPEALKSRWGPSKLLALALSLFVHLLTAMILIAAVALLLTGNFIGIALGAFLLLAAWVFRPRWGSIPRDALPAAELPAINAHSRAIALEVGTRSPDFIRISEGFNASVTEAGIRRRRVLEIGLPLFAVLDAQERVAVLGHEFGHYANGDPLRTWVIGTALNSLVTWHYLLVPSSLADDESGMAPGLLMVPINLFMLALSWIPLGLAYALVTLAFRDSQRGEYLADVHAARVGGSQALISGWDKMHLAGVYVGVAQSTDDQFWLNRSLVDEMRLRAAAFPDRERERARRIERKLASRLDLTHPPTVMRIAAVEARGPTVPIVHPTAAEAAAIDAELKAHEPEVQRVLIDTYRASLHY